MKRMSGFNPIQRMIVPACFPVLLLGCAARAASAIQKVDRIVVPHFEVENAGIRQTVKYLRILSRRLDPEGEGINFMLKLDPRITDDKRTRITLAMDNIPLRDLIRYICMAAGLQYKIEDHAVIIADQSLPLEKMETRFYPVEAGVLDTFRTRKGFKHIDTISGDDDDDNGND